MPFITGHEGLGVDSLFETCRINEKKGFFLPVVVTGKHAPTIDESMERVGESISQSGMM